MTTICIYVCVTCTFDRFGFRRCNEPWKYDRLTSVALFYYSLSKMQPCIVGKLYVQLLIDNFTLLKCLLGYLFENLNHVLVQLRGLYIIRLYHCLTTSFHPCFVNLGFQYDPIFLSIQTKNKITVVILPINNGTTFWLF